MTLSEQEPSKKYDLGGQYQSVLGFYKSQFPRYQHALKEREIYGIA